MHGGGWPGHGGPGVGQPGHHHPPAAALLLSHYRPRLRTHVNMQHLHYLHYLHCIYTVSTLSTLYLQYLHYIHYLQYLYCIYTIYVGISPPSWPACPTSPRDAPWPWVCTGIVQYSTAPRCSLFSTVQHSTVAVLQACVCAAQGSGPSLWPRCPSWCWRVVGGAGCCGPWACSPCWGCRAGQP